jgi:WD40 repeat protein
VVDAVSGRELARAQTERPIWQVAFSADGEALILSELQVSGIPTDTDWRLMLWRWRDAAPKVIERQTPVGGMAVSPANGQFATVEGHMDNDGNEIGRRRLALRSADGVLLTETPLDFNAWRAAFSQDGRHLAISGWGAARLFEVDGLRQVYGIGYTSSHTRSRDYRFQDSAAMSGAPSIGFLEKGGVFVASTASGAIHRRIEAEETTRLHKDARVTGTLASPDGSLLVLQGGDSVIVWDAATQDRLIRFAIPERSRLAFGGPDGRDLFALAEGRLMRVTWSPEELAAHACARLGNASWGESAERILGSDTGMPCAEAPSR